MSRNVYEILLQRMLDGHAKVSRIFQVGNKSQVIDACAADLPDARRRLYLIDGDLDLLLGIPAPDLPRLYSLRVYSSENLLFCATAVNEVAYRSLTNQDHGTAETIVGFLAFQETLVRVLKPLFVTYAAVYKLNSTIPTVSYNVMQLTVMNGKEIELDESKVRARIALLEAELLKTTKQEILDGTKQAVEGVIDGIDSHTIKYIAGKTYLLPLLLHCLRRKASLGGSIEQLKVQLAMFTDLDIDPGLQDAVLNAAV